MTQHREATAFAFVDEIRAQLRPEHCEATLAIKRDLFCRGELRQGLSMLSYQAVVEGGVRTVSGFRERRMTGADRPGPRLFAPTIGRRL